DENPLILGFRRPVHQRQDPDGYRRDIAVGGTVVGDEREAVGTVVVERRRVGERWRGATQPAVRRRRRDRVGEDRAVGIGDAEGNRLGRVLRGGDRLIA